MAGTAPTFCQASRFQQSVQPDEITTQYKVQTLKISHDKPKESNPLVALAAPGEEAIVNPKTLCKTPCGDPIHKNGSLKTNAHCAAETPQSHPKTGPDGPMNPAKAE
jgi:hypothetical protein